MSMSSCKAGAGLQPAGAGVKGAGAAEGALSRAEFLSGLRVWSDKPHVLNKRLRGAIVLHALTLAPTRRPWDFYVCSHRLNELTESHVTDIDKVHEFLLQLNLCKVSLEEDPPEKSINIKIMKLFPKQSSQECTYQLIAEDATEDVVFFAEVLIGKHGNTACPSFPYSFHWSEHRIELRALTGESDSEADLKSLKWLHDVVLPEVVKWGKESFGNENKQSICSGSLNLISNEVYYNKYNELKIKYGKEMVKIWPENTDPIKFVYEDVAIASYLLVLWESERQRLQIDKMQTFVDLGCGNGLLVYILVSEGHTGHGIDVRKRKIWDLYPSSVILQERTISPSDNHLFPEIGWIIGNHSDELTPWVPVIAARSSYNCNFFLLPCCCYNFNGSKYQRRDSSKSQYSEYLEHIKDLSEKCGFHTSVDRLKIPSTKRVCLIGTDRKYSEEKFVEMCQNIQTIVDKSGESKERKDEWITDFKPREATERVRNCTKIDKTLVESIVKMITTDLMKDIGQRKDIWNRGKLVELNELVSLVPRDMLKLLKSECGGLQTLLKNHHQIFEVKSGKVQLRQPQTVTEVMEKQRNPKSKTRKFSVKKTACWFYKNHPQGCPLSDENCSFQHVNKTKT